MQETSIDYHYAIYAKRFAGAYSTMDVAWIQFTFGAIGVAVTAVVTGDGLGTGPTAELIATEVQRREPLGYRVVGFLAEHPDEVGRTHLDFPVLRAGQELLTLVDSLSVDLIVVALENRRGKLPSEDQQNYYRQIIRH